KPSTLRALAGLESITSGDLLVDGKRINDVPPQDRDMAMVFENYALYPHLKVFDNIACRSLRAGRRERKSATVSGKSPTPFGSPSISTSAQPRFPAGSASASRLAGRSSGRQRCF